MAVLKAKIFCRPIKNSHENHPVGFLIVPHKSTKSGDAHSLNKKDKSKNDRVQFMFELKQEFI